MPSESSIDVEGLLAELVTGTRDVPAPVRHAAVRQVVDAIGVTIAALAEPTATAIIETTAGIGGRPTSRVIGSRLITSAPEAAWANGSLAHLLDFDDTGFSHPTACLMPAAMAIGEEVAATGHDLLVAMAIGYEVFERLAAVGRPYEPELRRRGIHPTSLWGAPAAAAVASRLLQLDTQQVRHALGIAAGNAFGLSQSFGSTGKGLNAGNAARSGVHAALLARAGFETDRHMISGRYGLLAAATGHHDYDLSQVQVDLGSRWSIVDPGISIKLHPACTSTLRAVEAALFIRHQPEFDAASVSSVCVDVHPDLLDILRFRAPQTGFEGKFSLDYVVASALLDGDLTIDSFSDEAATRPTLRAMIARTELRAHPEWTTNRELTPVAVTLADGRVFERSIVSFRGSRADPLSDEEVVGKFRMVASRHLTDAQVAQSVGPLMSLDTAEDVRDVLDFVTPLG